MIPGAKHLVLHSLHRLLIVAIVCKIAKKESHLLAVGLCNNSACFITQLLCNLSA